MKANQKILILLACLFVGNVLAISQEVQTHMLKPNKGRFYIYWGWNKEVYTQSDIHFKGQSYDFTLKDVVADDKQSNFSPRLYLNPSNLTIPQYNFRLGYFINESWSISLGADHMKYVARPNQIVKIAGYIHDTNSGYDGEYNDNSIILGKGFLEFEHTDGLNYLNVDVRKQFDLLKWKKISLLANTGLGLGVLVPRTDATLLNFERHDKFHLAGFGTNFLAALQIKIGNYFFIQSEYKLGYINMNDIRTTYSTNDSANQYFFFHQYNILFGSYFGF